MKGCGRDGWSVAQIGLVCGMCVQMMKPGGVDLAGLSSFFARHSAAALYSGRRISLQKGLAAEGSWRLHMIRHLGIAMDMRFVGGCAVAKVHIGQSLILEYSLRNAEPHMAIIVRRHDQDGAVLWLFIWKKGGSISGGVMRAVIDCRCAISEERSEASLGANTKGGYIHTPYRVLHMSCWQISGRRYRILPSASFWSTVWSTSQRRK